MHTPPLRRFALASASLLLLAACCSAGTGGTPGKPAKQPPAADDPAAEQRVIPLKHARASAAADLLREVFGARDKAGQRKHLAVGVDERTNSIVLSGPPRELAEAARFVQLVDVDAPPPEVDRLEFGVYALRSLTPDKVTEQALQPLLRTPRHRVIVDPARKLVIAHADRETLSKVEAVLNRLDQLADLPPVPPAPELEVRLVWLAAVQPGKNAALPGADLAAAVEEFRRLGHERAVVIAQTLVRTQPGVRFEQTGQARLEDAPCLLTATGRVVDQRGMAGLEIAVRASAAGKGGGPLCSLQTEVTLPLEKPAVLGVTPAHGVATAFVVQVRQVPPRGPARPAKGSGPGKAARPVQRE